MWVRTKKKKGKEEEERVGEKYTSKCEWRNEGTHVGKKQGGAREEIWPEEERGSLRSAAK